MADRGIIFSSPMVRALLDGRKTQTRRLLNPQPKAFPIDVDGTPCEVGCLHVEGEPRPRIFTGRVLTAQTLPHAVGDRLYVRESWSHTWEGVWDIATARRAGDAGVIYMADGQKPGAKYWPSIHMPREFSRLTLIVTDVRVQRLQEISEEDAIAESCAGCLGPNPEFPDEWDPSPREEFEVLWNSLHTDPGTRWEDNPWIYAVTFDVRRGNIDQRGGTMTTGCPTLDEARPPAEWCELLAARNIVISERTLRERANRLGQRIKIGRAMLITPAQMEAILQAGQGEEKPCRSNSTAAGTPSGFAAASNTRAARSPNTTAAAREHLMKAARARGCATRKPAGSVVTFSATKRG